MSHADDDALRAKLKAAAESRSRHQTSDEDTLRATSTDVADESQEIQEMRKQLMGMDLAELKTTLAEIKEAEPDVELPSGGKEEIVAWAIERAKARKEREEKEKRVEEEERVEQAREEARLLIVEPHQDTPGRLHAFLFANPLAVPAFVKSIVTNADHAAWLGEAVKATPELAELTDADGLHAFAFAHLRCRQACERYSNLRR
eukprot:scaffold55924_cov59-Phaeocystis_antarctica.AAC.2